MNMISRNGRWVGRQMAMVGLVVVLVLATVACEPIQPRPNRGFWLTPAELEALPMSGVAWDRLVEAAEGEWGLPDLSDNNANSDVDTLAGALVAARTGDRALADRVRLHIALGVATVEPEARVLELSRNITSYIIAADLVGLTPANDDAFRAWLRDLLTRPLQGHSGGTDLVTTAMRSGNNWGTMARAAVTAAALYLEDDALLVRVANAHSGWLGVTTDHEIRWSSTGWHVSTPPAGVNRPGTQIAGQNVSGVQPEEQRRTGEPGSGSIPKGSYPWEGLQGAVVTGVLLHRAGVLDINAGDKALARAATWLTYDNENPAEGDDTWLPWLLNEVAGTSLPTTPSSPGKNMGWTDWSHQ